MCLFGCVLLPFFFSSYFLYLIAMSSPKMDSGTLRRNGGDRNCVFGIVFRFSKTRLLFGPGAIQVSIFFIMHLRWTMRCVVIASRL